MKNAAVLLGIPVFGGISGLLGGAVFMGGFSVHMTGTVVFAVVGLLLGIVIGGVAYKRVLPNDPPIISRVIRTRAEVASLSEDNPSDLQNAGVGCDGCSGCLPASK